eukprot:6222587-Amphidinium_carterae.1
MFRLSAWQEPEPTSGRHETPQTQRSWDDAINAAFDVHSADLEASHVSSFHAQRSVPKTRQHGADANLGQGTSGNMAKKLNNAGCAADNIR